MGRVGAGDGARGGARGGAEDEAECDVRGEVLGEVWGTMCGQGWAKGEAQGKATGGRRMGPVDAVDVGVMGAKGDEGCCVELEATVVLRGTDRYCVCVPTTPRMQSGWHPEPLAQQLEPAGTACASLAAPAPPTLLPRNQQHLEGLKPA